MDSIGSSASEIIFTEDQYFTVAQNPYSWSNVVQIQSMSSTVGLMIGLSLSDRNIRRLLQAVDSTPVQAECYLVLKKKSHPVPQQNDLEEIERNARKHKSRFPGGMAKSKVANRRDEEIEGIITAVSSLDDKQQIRLLEEMGVRPLWVNDYSEIPQILDRIIR